MTNEPLNKADALATIFITVVLVLMTVAALVTYNDSFTEPTPDTLKELSP